MRSLQVRTSTIMSQITMKKIDETLCKEIAALESEIFSDAWSEELLSDTFKYDYYRLISRRESGRLSGYIIYSILGGEAELQRIAVAPDHRRCGIASKLMDEMVTSLKSEKVESVFLEVRSGNTPAISLYEKYGYKNIAVRKNYYTDPTEDAVMMKLEIGEIE